MFLFYLSISAVVCVTLLDRLLGDQVNMTPEEHDEWEQRPQELMAKFISKRLKLWEYTDWSEIMKLFVLKDL